MLLLLLLGCACSAGLFCAATGKSVKSSVAMSKKLRAW